MLIHRWNAFIGGPAILVCLCILLLATSCGGRLEDMEGKTVFRYNEASNITSLDPGLCTKPGQYLGGVTVVQ
jgi:hypothetical protein